MVDGYVWLDRDQRPGLDAKLFESLGEISPDISVAKSRFHDVPGTPSAVNRQQCGDRRVDGGGLHQVDARSFSSPNVTSNR